MSCYIVIHCNSVAGIVKPDIILFGEKLPPRFRAKFKLINRADLVIVMGTSLKVHPFSSLIDTRSLPESTPLVVINSANPGIERDRLLVLPGDIEVSTRELMEDVGWGEAVHGLPTSVKASVRADVSTMKEDAFSGDRAMPSDADADALPGRTPSISGGAGRLPRKRKLSCVS